MNPHYRTVYVINPYTSEWLCHFLSLGRIATSC